MEVVRSDVNQGVASMVVGRDSSGERQGQAGREAMYWLLMWERFLPKIPK